MYVKCYFQPDFFYISYFLLQNPIPTWRNTQYAISLISSTAVSSGTGNSAVQLIITTHKIVYVYLQVDIDNSIEGGINSSHLVIACTRTYLHYIHKNWYGNIYTGTSVSKSKALASDRLFNATSTEALYTCINRHYSRVHFFVSLINSICPAVVLVVEKSHHFVLYPREVLLKFGPQKKIKKCTYPINTLFIRDLARQKKNNRSCEVSYLAGLCRRLNEKKRNKKLVIIRHGHPPCTPFSPETTLQLDFEPMLN